MVGSRATPGKYLKLPPQSSTDFGEPGCVTSGRSGGVGGIREGILYLSHLSSPCGRFVLTIILFGSKFDVWCQKLIVVVRVARGYIELSNRKIVYAANTSKGPWYVNLGG